MHTTLIILQQNQLNRIFFINHLISGELVQNASFKHAKVIKIDVVVSVHQT